SFKLPWEPIVSSPRQAYDTFMQSALDVLVLEDFILYKDEQPVGLQFWAEPKVARHAPPDSPWADPRTGDPLIVSPTEAANPLTGSRFPVEDGIPRLFVPIHEGWHQSQDVTTTIVRQFYEKTPAPTYDDVPDPRALLEKMRASLFARLLNEQIPYDARVLEVG